MVKENFEMIASDGLNGLFWNAFLFTMVEENLKVYLLGCFKMACLLE